MWRHLNTKPKHINVSSLLQANLPVQSNTILRPLPQTLSLSTSRYRLKNTPPWYNKNPPTQQSRRRSRSLSMPTSQASRLRARTQCLNQPTLQLPHTIGY